MLERLIIFAKFLIDQIKVGSFIPFPFEHCMKYLFLLDIKFSLKRKIKFFDVIERVKFILLENYCVTYLERCKMTNKK